VGPLGAGCGAARGLGASLARGRLGWRPGPPRRVTEEASSGVAPAAQSCARRRRHLVQGGWHGLPWCIASSDEVPGRRAPRREVEEGVLVGRTELVTTAFMQLTGKRGSSQGKGGETPGAKEKGMVVYCLDGLAQRRPWLKHPTATTLLVLRPPRSGGRRWGTSDEQHPTATTPPSLRPPRSAGRRRGTSDEQHPTATTRRESQRRHQRRPRVATAPFTTPNPATAAPRRPRSSSHARA
jgi:hypothetical protein